LSIVNIEYTEREGRYSLPLLATGSGADSVELGLECTTCPLPFAAIEFAAARFHAGCIDVALNLRVANVTEDLQVGDRVVATLALRDHVVDLQGAVIGATANGACMVVFLKDYFAGRFVSDLGHRLVSSVSITII